MSTTPPFWADAALFLDVDGTLLEFAPRPEAVVVPPGLRRLLLDLAAALDGALALVSGRSLDSIDALFDLPQLAAAGLHGLQRRLPGRAVEVAVEPTVSSALERLRAALRTLTDAHPGVRIEDKHHALAVHYRAAPTAGAAVEARLREWLAALDRSGELGLLHGNHVVEIKPAAVNKGTAVEHFMRAPPFAGRRPVFVGDDVTDEDGIRAAQALGGVGVKVGDAPSAARCRLPDPAAVRAWLGAYREFLYSGPARRTPPQANRR
ncbi:MAG: trehalose 6-phosphate phosphatase [Gammaproteobacteria bacterium]|nr:MAG: trehalose 6-phosphate phosphatase [Gammaproteobacteria bacterium]